MAIDVAVLRTKLVADASQFTSAMGAADKSASKAAAGIKKLGGVYQDANGKWREANGRFVSTTRQAELGLNSVGASASKAKSRFEGLKQEAAKTKSRFDGMGKSVIQTTAAFVGVTGVALGFRAAGNAVIGFDKEMRNVNSLAKLSEKDFRGLEKQVLGMAGKTAQAPKVLAAGLYDLVSSGFKAQDAIKVLKASAIAATAGLTTTDVAAGAVAGALNAYGLKAKDATRVSDVLFRTVDQGVITFEQLAQGIGPVLPVARKLGVGLEQVGAMTATLTKAGIPAAEAFTYQKGAMVALIKPTDAMSGALKKLGVASGAELIKKTGSLQGALELLSKSVGGNATKMAELFPEIRGMTAAMGVTSTKSKDAARDLKALQNSGGATAAAFKEQSKSISLQWSKLKATVEAVVVRASIAVLGWVDKNKDSFKQIGNAVQSIVVPAFNAIKSVISTVVSNIKTLVNGFKEGKTGAVLLVAGLAGVVAGLTAFKILTGVIAALRGMAIAMIAVNVAMRANPIVAVVSVLVALGAALVIAYKHSETFRDVCKKAFQVVRQVAGGAFDVITLGIRLFLGGLEKILNAATKLPFVGKKFEGARDAVRRAREEVEALGDRIRGLPKNTELNIWVKQRGSINGSNLPVKKGEGKRAQGASAENLLFRTEDQIADLEAKRDRLSEMFEANDAAGRRAGLKKTIASPNVKGKADDQRRKQARQELKEMIRDLGRAKQLAKIDLEIKGLDKARAMRDALKSIGEQLKGKIADAVDKYRTNWNKTAGAAFDAQTDVILANTEAAKELRALRDAETADARAEEVKRAQDRIAAAMASGDATELLEAQAEAAKVARSQRITDLEAQVAAESTAISAQRAAEREAMEEAAAAAFEQSLTSQLNAELQSLEDRKQAYATFVRDVQAILGPLGLTFEADPAAEAALKTPLGTALPKRIQTKRKTPTKKARKRALGGVINPGEWSWVGERGPELVKLPSGSRVFPSGESGAMGGGGVSIVNHITVTSLDPRAAGTYVVRALDDWERQNGRRYQRA